MASQYPASSRPLCIVTGASSGIGRELALLAAREGFDLIIAADTPLHSSAAELTALGASVASVEVDLASREGCDAVYEAITDRPVAALMANGGHGLGCAFLEQDFEEVRHVVDTNIAGTIYLIQRVAQRMVSEGAGKILITGSIAGYMPGTFQAVYNGTKAFVDSLSLALRNELKDSGVTVTCLMPGVTDTEFFQRADLMDTKVGTRRTRRTRLPWRKPGFEAMMNGESDVVAGLNNKLQVAIAGRRFSSVTECRSRMPRTATRSSRSSRTT